MRQLALVMVLVAWGTPARATVITIGNIDPAGSGGVGPSNIVTRQDPWIVSGNLIVADTASGTLNVTDGGVVNNTVGSIGAESGATGVATINGANSQWNNSEYLYVGVEGDGTLNVTDGGVVSNTYSSIGQNSGSTGEVTVTGANSQ